MARSSKKGPFVDLSLEKKVAKAKETNDRKPMCHIEIKLTNKAEEVKDGSES